MKQQPISIHIRKTVEKAATLKPISTGKFNEPSFSDLVAKVLAEKAKPTKTFPYSTQRPISTKPTRK